MNSEQTLGFFDRSDRVPGRPEREIEAKYLVSDDGPGPTGGFRDCFVLVRRDPVKEGCEARVTRVAHGDHRITAQP